jgi:hypothetical protein
VRAKCQVTHMLMHWDLGCLEDKQVKPHRLNDLASRCYSDPSRTKRNYSSEYTIRKLEVVSDLWAVGRNQLCVFVFGQSGAYQGILKRKVRSGWYSGKDLKLHRENEVDEYMISQYLSYREKKARVLWKATREGQWLQSAWPAVVSDYVYNWSRQLELH